MLKIYSICCSRLGSEAEEGGVVEFCFIPNDNLVSVGVSVGVPDQFEVFVDATEFKTMIEALKADIGKE